MNASIKEAAKALQAQSLTTRSELETLRQAIQVVAQTGEAMDLSRSDSGRQCMSIIAKSEQTINQLQNLIQSISDLSVQIQEIQ